MSLSTAELRVLDDLLQQALDLPLAERAAWIDALPPPHDRLAPLLRENLLNDDLSGSTETADFLGALPPLPVRQVLRDDPVAGERIGPYRLVRPLGDGGMSSVWLAERADGTLRREVALKLPHRHLLDRGLAARMQRERDILASLNHDYIARLYDAGVDELGRPYLTLEYVAGQPVNVFCEQAGVALATRIRLMVQVARAVAHAHANLVVHRDLKPSNILVTAGEGVPGVKLLDFGIAKLLTRDEGATEVPDLTQLLGRALTPDYASPEQLMEQPVTTASDIYSLGVVLYEVVTGAKPYQLKRQSAAALADAVAHADIMRPSRRAALGPHPQDARRIEGDLDAILMKALKPLPAERYATASALADDLERFLAHQPVMAQPDSAAYRARRFVRRHAVAVSAGAGISLALVAGAAVALWQAQQARIETAKTRAVKDFLLSIITVGSVDRQDALMRRRQPIGDVLLDAARTMPGRFADQPEVRAEVQGLLGTALSELSMHDSARGLQEERLIELDKRGAPLLERMTARVDLAITLLDRTEATRGMALLDEVMVALEPRRDRASQLVLAEALRAIAMVKVERYDGKGEGVRDAARALAIVEAHAPGSKSHVSTLALLGFAHGHNRDLPNAEIAFGKAIELAHALPEAERGYEATVRLRYAEALIPRRFHLRALDQLRAALAIIEKTTGADTFRWARTAVLVANLNAAIGNAPQAFTLFERVLQVYAKLSSEIDPLFASAAQALYAGALLDYGRPADALRLTTLAYAPYRDEAASAKASASAVWLAATRHGLALQGNGDYAQAEKVLQRALAIGRAGKFSRAYSDFTQGERLLAQNFLYRGEYAAAERLFREIIEVDGAPAERFVAQRNFARPGLARALMEQGRLDDAATEIAALRKIIDAVAADEVAISRPIVAQLESVEGALAMKRRDPAAAEVHFRRAIEILQARSDAGSPALAAARAELGLALVARGDRVTARKLADDAHAALASHHAVAPYWRRPLADLDKALLR